MLTGLAFGHASCEWLHSQDLLFFLAASRFFPLACTMVPAAASLIFLQHWMQQNPNHSFPQPRPLSPRLLLALVSQEHGIYWLAWNYWSCGGIILLSGRCWEWRRSGFPKESFVFLLEGGRKDGTWAGDTYFCHNFSAQRTPLILDTFIVLPCFLSRLS